MGMKPKDTLKILLSAKTVPVAFGLGLSVQGVPELLAEKNSTPGRMFGRVKALPGMRQACGGVVSSDGSTTVTFTCADPMPGFIQHVEAWAITNKLVFKAVQAMPEVPKAEAVIEKDAVPTPAGSDDTEQGAEPVTADLPHPFMSADFIKKCLGAAKTKPIPFGFGVGDGEAPGVLAMHPQKTGKRLATLVRKQSEIRHLSHGTVKLEGAVATFICDGEPFEAMRPRLRQLFKQWKFPLTVKVLGPAGESTGDDALSGLKRDLAALVPALKLVGATGQDIQAEISAEYSRCRRLIASGDAAEGQLAIERLRAISRRPAVQPPVMPEAPVSDEPVAALGEPKASAAGDGNSSAPPKAPSRLQAALGKIGKKLRAFSGRSNRPLLREVAD